MSASLRITEANYYSHQANLAYFNNTQIKQYLECPAQWLAIRNALFIPKSDVKDSKESRALVYGNYVDAALTGSSFELQDYVNENKKILNYRGGNSPSQDRENLDKAIARVKEDEYFMSRLKGSKQKIFFTQNFYGYPIRIKLDIFNLADTFFTDIKTTRGLNHREYCPSNQTYMSWIDFRKYPLQFCLYQKMIEIMTGIKMSGYLAALEKTDNPIFDVWNMTDGPNESFMAELLDVILSALRGMHIYKDYDVADVDSCGICEYCATVRTLTTARTYERNEKINWNAK